MIIRELLTYLKNSSTVAVYQTALNCPLQVIDKILPVTSLPRISNPNVLYIYEGVPTDPLPDKCSVLSICKGIFSDIPTTLSEGNLIAVQALDISQIANYLEEIISSEKDFISAKLKLTDALIADQGPQYISDIASSVFGNPFWLVDINFQFITNPVPELVADDPHLQQEVELGYVTDKSVENIRQRGIYKRVQQSGEVFCYSVYKDNDRTIMAAPIRIKSITVGYLQLLNSTAPYRCFDSVLLHFAAKIFAAELQKQQNIEINQSSMLSSLLINLLDGDLRNRTSIYQRMVTLGIPVGRHFQFLSLEICRREIDRASLSVLANQFCYLLPNSIYVVETDRILFLINFYSNSYFEEDTIDEICHSLSDNHLHAGLSPVFDDILLAPEYSKLAIKAAQLGELLDSVHFLHQYDDYVIYHIIDESYRNVLLTATVQGRNIDALVKYDTEHNSNLLESLYCYLDSSKNIAAASNKLNIHGNTLRLRIERAKEITGCTFDCGQEILEFLIAYMMAEYKNALTQRS